MPRREAVLLYDGDCAFCRRAVDRWVPRTSSVRPVPAGSREGRRLAKQAGVQRLVDATVVLVRGDRVWLRSAAVVQTLWAGGGVRRLQAVAVWLIPWPVRDLAYRWVARNRHRFAAVDDL